MDLFIPVVFPLPGKSGAVRFVGAYDEKILAEAAIYRELYRIKGDRRSAIIECELNVDIVGAVIEFSNSEEHRLTQEMWDTLSEITEFEQNRMLYYSKSWLRRRFSRKPKRKKW